MADSAAAATNLERSYAMQFGPGLLFLVEDDLSVGVYLDDAYVGGFKLDNLDQFLRLRKLLDGPDFVAVLTSLEAREASDLVNA